MCILTKKPLHPWHSHVTTQIRLVAPFGALCLTISTGGAHAADLTIEASQSGRPISPDLLDVFCEDLGCFTPFGMTRGLYAVYEHLPPNMNRTQHRPGA